MLRLMFCAVADELSTTIEIFILNEGGEEKKKRREENVFIFISFFFFPSENNRLLMTRQPDKSFSTGKAAIFRATPIYFCVHA